MNANKIGNQQFIRLEMGAYSPAGERTEEITRAGVDGVALWKLGRKGEPFTVGTVCDFQTASAAQDAAEAYAAMMGTVVTLIDAGGNTYPELAVRAVVSAQPRGMRNAVGGVNNGNWILAAVWTLQDVSTGKK